MTIHDYTQRGWGHDFMIMRHNEDWTEIKLAGWGSGLKQGDLLLLPAPDGKPALHWEITNVEYTKDPLDMWFVIIKPYKPEVNHAPSL